MQNILVRFYELAPFNVLLASEAKLNLVVKMITALQ